MFTTTLETLERISKAIETAETERAAQVAAIEAKKEPYSKVLTEAEKTVAVALTNDDPKVFESAQRKISSARSAISLIDESLTKLKESTLFDIDTYNGYCADIKASLQSDTDSAAELILKHLEEIDSICGENLELIQKGNEMLAHLQHHIMFDPETWTSATGTKVLLPTDIQKFTDSSVTTFPKTYKEHDIYRKGKE